MNITFSCTLSMENSNMENSNIYPKFQTFFKLIQSFSLSVLEHLEIPRIRVTFFLASAATADRELAPDSRREKVNRRKQRRGQMRARSHWTIIRRPPSMVSSSKLHGSYNDDEHGNPRYRDHTARPPLQPSDHHFTVPVTLYYQITESQIPPRPYADC